MVRVTDMVIDKGIMDQLGVLVVVGVEAEVAAVSVEVLAHHQVQELPQGLEEPDVDKSNSICDKLKLLPSISITYDIEGHLFCLFLLLFHTHYKCDN